VIKYVLHMIAMSIKDFWHGCVVVHEVVAGPSVEGQRVLDRYAREEAAMNKVLRVIAGCTTLVQIYAARELVVLYKRLHNTPNGQRLGEWLDVKRIGKEWEITEGLRNL
jgi:hypothetical protein